MIAHKYQQVAYFSLKIIWHNLPSPIPFFPWSKVHIKLKIEKQNSRGSAEKTDSFYLHNVGDNLHYSY